MSKAIKATQEEKDLADYIHTKTCGYSHTDQCSYFYRSWENPGESLEDRLKALDKARALIAKYGLEAIEKAKEIMGAIRN